MVMNSTVMPPPRGRGIRKGRVSPPGVGIASRMGAATGRGLLALGLLVVSSACQGLNIFSLADDAQLSIQ